MRTFQRRAHHLHIANAFKAVIYAPAGHVDNDLLDGLVIILGVHAIGGAELFRQFKFGWIGINGDDASRFRLTRALNHRQTNTAQPEYRHAIAFLHFGSVMHRADACSHAAAEQANLFGIGFRVDFRQRNFRHHGIFAKGRAAHIVINRLALIRKARRAVGHHPFALSGAHGGAKIGFAAFAKQAFAAFSGIKGNDVVAGFH